MTATMLIRASYLWDWH